MSGNLTPDAVKQVYDDLSTALFWSTIQNDGQATCTTRATSTAEARGTRVLILMLLTVLP